MATFDRLRDETYIRLTTFRRSGTPVSTAVWFVLHEGKLVITTEDHTGKIKRIRNRGDVTVAPATIRGKPTGAEQAGSARIIEPDRSSPAYRALKKKYGWLFNIIMFIHKLQKHREVLIEVEPV